jgi:hypothetical protein
LKSAFHQSLHVDVSGDFHLVEPMLEKLVVIEDVKICRWFGVDPLNVDYVWV